MPEFEEQVMHGHREELKTAVDVEAKLLADLVAPLKKREQRVEAITAQTDPLRFLADGSRYFFTYFMDGTRINIPTNKSLNGKNQGKRGFAVVAEEVRNLAMRSAEAAANTTELLEEAAGSAKQGVEIAGEVVGAFAAIENQTKSMGAVIEEIASAADVQASGIAQISSAMQEMDKVTQSNAASAEETAAAAEELASQTTEVDRTVTDLRVLVGEKIRTAPRGAERQAVAAARSVKYSG